jgi:SOS-response transcriptional repressor LexA
MGEVEHCIKHVVQTDAGVVIMSDNPEYPARLIAPDQQPTVLGVPVGYTRIYGQ